MTAGLPRTRAALGGAIVLGVVFAALLVARDYLAWRRGQQEALAGLAGQVKQATEDYFARYEALFRAVAEADCFEEHDAGGCGEYFSRLNRLFPQVVNFAAVGADGRFFASGRPFGPGGPPDASHLGFFTALAAGAPRHVMDPHVGPVTGEEVTGFVIPLRTADGGFGGLLGTSIRLAELADLWGAAPVGAGRSVAVVDRRGVVLYAGPGSPLERGTPVGAVPGLAAFGAGEREAGRLTVGGRAFDLHAARVPVAEWVVLALGPAAGGLGAYLSGAALAWALGLPLLGVAGVGLLLFRREARAVGRLAESERELR
ncbi:MAG: cache domain-containing protein, partial [Deferrisomatales bacterium]